MQKGIIGKKIGMTQIFDEKGNVTFTFYGNDTSYVYEEGERPLSWLRKKALRIKKLI